ncbi:MAG: phage terminase large subunit family protein [Methanothrix sp.]|nr:phage terminase large subunit family protein [Methanothrix sp.]
MTPDEALSLGLLQIKAKWPVLYTALRHHRTTRGEPLTFSDKPWLEAIYQDESREIVIRKCSQVGITEYAICRMLSLAEQGKRGMYLLPDDNWRAIFVADRIDGLMDRVPAYKVFIGHEEKTMDSRQFKLIHGVAWKFAGSHAKTAGSTGEDLKKPKAAFEYQASVLIIDEYDEHEQNDLVYFYDRLADETEPVILKFGNPTIESKGIAAEFRKSDAKRWFVRCPCGHEQTLTWLTHFVESDGEYGFRLRDPRGWPICESCHKPFDRTGPGQWKKANPGSKVSGYAISRLFVYKSDSDIQDLWEKFLDAQGNQSKLQNFHNNWLGETYENADEQVTEGLLELASRKGPESLEGWKPSELHHLVAGVDQGKNFHVRISELQNGERIPRYIGILQSWPQVNSILDEFHVTTVVVDAQGGGYAETRAFVEQREGAYMCYYVSKDSVTNQYVLDNKHQVVKVNRTELCDVFIACLKNGTCLMPRNYASHLKGELKSQLMTPVRTIDAGGRPVWTKGVDHFFHAHVYETVAVLISGMSNSVREKRSWRI